jgi:hypothetical protein
MSETTDGLQEITDQVSQQGERLGLAINSDRTKVMTVSKEQLDLQIIVRSNKLEQVKEFVYLGGQISQDGKCESDIKRRVGLTWAVFNKLTNIWNCHNLTLKIKLHVFESSCPGADVRLRVLDNEERRRKKDFGCGNVLAPKNTQNIKAAAHQK